MALLFRLARIFLLPCLGGVFNTLDYTLQFPWTEPSILHNGHQKVASYYWTPGIRKYNVANSELKNIISLDSKDWEFNRTYLFPDGILALGNTAYLPRFMEFRDLLTHCTCPQFWKHCFTGLYERGNTIHLPVDSRDLDMQSFYLWTCTGFFIVLQNMKGALAGNPTGCYSNAFFPRQ